MQDFSTATRAALNITHQAAHLYSEQMTVAADSGHSAKGVVPKLSSCSTFTASALLQMLQSLLAAMSDVASLDNTLFGYLASSLAVIMCRFSATCSTMPVPGLLCAWFSCCCKAIASLCKKTAADRVVQHINHA
jgi:hypothetical protein